MPDDSGLPVQLVTLGVALVAFGLGCHFWADRIYRTVGLAVGAAQLCRYFLHKRFNAGEPVVRSDNATKWMKVCDHLAAVLLVTAVMHAIAST
jgi:hypothetical protein